METAAPKTCTQKSGISILVTVGTDLPFDRLIKAIDNWAPGKTDVKVFAQIGNTNFQPRNIEYAAFLEPSEFNRRFTSADYIISHAGMGTILSSLQYQKPLIVIPRIAAKGEHRNEHQLATAKFLSELNRINVAKDENQLIEMLEELNSLATKEPIGPYASKTLTDKLAAFINS